MEPIKPDSRNVRVHDAQNCSAIKKSLKDLGAGRSILIDAENVIIGGNGVYEQAQSLGIPIKVIESDGRELIAIKRTDLKTDDDKRRALAIADNKIGDMSFFDFDKLKGELESLNLADFDINITGFQDFELGFLDSNTTNSAIPTNPRQPEGKSPDTPAPAALNPEEQKDEDTEEVDANTDEYHDMPEYNQECIDNFRVIVHFRSLQDKLSFSSVVRQKILETTKAIWYPEAQNIDEKNYVCSGE